jgi:hypothetical protein
MALIAVVVSSAAMRIGRAELGSGRVVDAVSSR